MLVMQMAYNGNFMIVGSDVLEKEMALISDLEKRSNVESMYHELRSKIVTLDEAVVKRAENIMRRSSIKAFDSLHLASAEAVADILLTTDIKFMKAANRLDIGIKVQNPVDFVLEVNNHE